MDTRFWGPSGWKLMHLSAVMYTPDKREHMNDWLSVLPYILPCKFCRASLISYYEELPPDYTNSRSLSKWLWKIHGKVNDKLRSQGQNIPKDPPFSVVYNKYLQLANNLDKPCGDAYKYCSEQIWDFLFSVAFQHPMSTKSLPMPDTPPTVHACNLSEPDKCRWNLMEPGEKMPYFRRFWVSLKYILPPSFSEKWERTLRHNPMRIATKGQTMRWLYRQYCGIYENSNMKSFPAIYDELEKHSSDCNKSKRARTCRRLPSRKRKLVSRKLVKNM